MKIERHCPHLYQISVRLTHDEQTSLILQLIDNGHYNFKESVANILISMDLPKI